jgi:ribA/ribD-fused uncharacterized protein
MIKGFRGKNRWLSNFVEAEVSFQGEKYASVEHAYVAAKTQDKELRKIIQSFATAGEAKRFGKSLDLRPNWDKMKLCVMENLVKQKFSLPEFAEKLLATGDQEIVEENTWHDNFFGSCLCEDCGNKGENHLGKILMKVREGLNQLSLDFSK